MKLKIALLLGFVFFILALFTLPHYGINWDTINHLPRGQAYLHYLLTGKKDYLDMPKLFDDWTQKDQWYWQNPKSLAIDANIPKEKVPTRSMYQDDGTTFDYFMDHDGDGHPPLSDILSSAFNRVLFGKLRLVNDIDAYRVYGIFLATSLVCLIYWWVAKLYGRIPGLVAALSLAAYPLFWSETHFNTEKDVPETVFWSFMFFFVWHAVTRRNWKSSLVAGVFFGLALGTKFNILFSIFAISLWIGALLLAHFFSQKKNKLSVAKDFIKLAVSVPFSILVGLSIFVGSWPYLWPDTLGRVQKVIGFYKQIGSTTNLDPRYVGPLGISTYPIQWIAYTTPLIILALFIIGVATVFIRFRKEKDKDGFLFLCWFLVPIARVVWPGANTYGGFRQIMEYIPAMAVLAGIGTYGLLQLSKAKVFKIFISVSIGLSFLLLISKLISIHPNENVFFNSLAGGLQGAKDKNIPYWGFSFGAPYRVGIEWINDHAEQGSNVVYAYELIPNIPRIFIRPDLVFTNANRSGYLAKGEYVISLTYQGTAQRSYFDKYLDKFVKPVYEAKVDNVSVLKVWKNDEDHLYNPGQKATLVKTTTYKRTPAGLVFDLGSIKNLARLEINYTDSRCVALAAGYVEISSDNVSWQRLPGVLPDDWRISALGEQPKSGHFIEPFVGEPTQFIHLSLEPGNTCLYNIKNYQIYAFD